MIRRALALALALAACTPRWEPDERVSITSLGEADAAAALDAMAAWSAATHGAVSFRLAPGSPSEIRVSPNVPLRAAGVTHIHWGEPVWIALRTHGLDAADRTSTIAHEMGHALGLYGSVRHGPAGTLMAPGDGGYCLDAVTLAEACTAFPCPRGWEVVCWKELR